MVDWGRIDMKVEIQITEGHNYCSSFKNGASFVSVDYTGRNYGGGIPCDDDSEVNFAVENAKKTIIDMGDVPVVVDKRSSAGLGKWLE